MNVYVNEMKLLTCRKMSAVSHEEVVIGIVSTVKVPERFKLRVSLIGYLSIYQNHLLIKVGKSSTELNLLKS